MADTQASGQGAPDDRPRTILPFGVLDLLHAGQRRRAERELVNSHGHSPAEATRLAGRWLYERDQRRLRP